MYSTTTTGVQQKDEGSLYTVHYTRNEEETGIESELPIFSFSELLAPLYYIESFHYC